MKPLVWSLLALFFLEALAFGFFVPWYYRLGVTIVRRRLPHRYPVKKGFSVNALSKMWGRDAWTGSALVFRRIDADTIAFRPSFQFLGLPRMQNTIGGTIRTHREDRTVEVRCFTSWWLLLLTVGLPFAAAGLAFAGHVRVAVALGVFAAILGASAWFLLRFCREIAMQLEANLRKS